VTITASWWADTTLGADLGVAGTSTDDINAAMDWLVARQDVIEAKLVARHPGPEANPGRMALFDLSSSWLEVTRCPLAARGYSRDGKKGRLQIEYGLLTDPAGRPVPVRVLPGLLPHLAPAPGVGAADLHRPGPARPRQPGRPRPAAPPPPRPEPDISTTPSAGPAAACAGPSGVRNVTCASGCWSRIAIVCHEM